MMKPAIRPALALLAAASAAACATSRTEPVTPETAPPAAVSFSMQPARFADVPGWQSADLAPALAAFRRQCANWRARGADAQVGANARYGGRVGEWLPACTAADSVSSGGARAFFEAHFTPNMVVSQNGQARLTAYYEPIVRVSRTPAPGMSEPLRPRPNDMITVDIAAFAQAYDSETLRGAPRTLTGRLEGDRVRPYPSRSEITQNPGPAIAYANPVDVYNLQVQGSGRIEFPDGQQRRAAFAAQNGYRWRSAIGAARESGQLPEGAGTWRGFRSWMEGLAPDRQRTVLNADQSYVFFEDQAITDPSIGPRGAANVHLTPQGSMAVDPAFHPYGALIFVDAVYEGSPFRRLMVAQDTGGAIRRGPLRGDVFWGTGPEAGQAAERMNADAPRFWTLVPRGAAVASLDPGAAAR